MPTTAYTDGDFVYPSQNGARQVSLPLIQEQEYYCTQTVRQMLQLSQFWEPSLYNRTSYTNVLTYSDAASNAAWTKVAVTVATESSTDPEGGTTASLLAETTANSAHSIAQAASGTGVVTFGAFVKAKERTFVRLRINNATNGNLAIAIFNLTLGKVESGTGTIKRMPGGWCYCTVSGTATVAGNTCYVELASNATTTSYAGTLGSGLYTWRLNAVFASSVSPTPATTAATPAIFTETAAVVATVPLVDWDDPLSFLVDESQPDQSTLELGVCQWQRTFCRVSKQTITPSSIIVSKPSPLGSGSTIMGTDVFFHQPEAAYNTYDIYSVTNVDIDQGAPSFAITGGTYTITAGSYTTASISYNATAGDVQDALNLLPSVITAGLAVVSGSATVGLGFSIIFGSAITYGTVQINAGSLVTQPLTGSYTVISGDTMPSGAGSGAIGTIEKPFKIFSTVENPYAPGAITAGTYSLTYYAYGGGISTTSTLSYAATSAQIGAALNALPAIQAIGGVTMYEWDNSYDIGLNTLGQFNGQIVISFYHYSPTLTVDAGQLQVPPITPIVTEVANSFGKSQHILLIPGNAGRQVTAENHGFSTGDTAFIEASYVSSTSPATAYTTTYYVPVTAFEVTGANSIRFTGNPLDGYMTAASITKVGRLTFTGYSPGPQNVRARKVADYYLPGFTPNIATFEDIPIVTSENDGEPFFSAMIAGGDINYVVGELGVWRGPIVYQQSVLVNSRDLGDYVPISTPPNFIAGLVAWWDASQITGYTDGQAISSWVDFSGNARNALQATTIRRPTYQTNEQNGLPCVRFDSTNQTHLQTAISTLQQQHVFMVAKVTSAVFTNSYSNPGGLMATNAIDGDTSIFNGVLGTGRFDISTAYGTSPIYRLNGSVNTSGNAGTLSAQIYQMEATSVLTNGTIFYIGMGAANQLTVINSDIFEIVVFQAALSEELREQLVNYLAEKWDITV